MNPVNDTGAPEDDRTSTNDQVPTSAPQVQEVAHESEGAATAAGGNNRLWLPSPSQPMAVARFFVHHCLHDIKTLRFWRGGWWMWRTTHWSEVEDRAVRSILWQFTEHASF